VAKGAAVRTQNACWERSLRTRIVLQKGLTLAAKMPAPEYAPRDARRGRGVAPALAVAAASARGALDALLRLQAALMDGNPAIGEALREGENDGDADETGKTPKSVRREEVSTRRRRRWTFCRNRRRRFGAPRTPRFRATRRSATRAATGGTGKRR